MRVECCRQGEEDGKAVLKRDRRGIGECMPNYSDVVLLWR
jgi:hypothetical protein